MTSLNYVTLWFRFYYTSVYVEENTQIWKVPTICYFVSHVFVENINEWNVYYVWFGCVRDAAFVPEQTTLANTRLFLPPSFRYLFKNI